MVEKRWALNIEGLEKGMPDEVALEIILDSTLKPIKREEVNIDPFKYEAAKYHLHSILMEGCFALVRTSGSPVVTDVTEYVSGVYDADGNTACISTGVLAHVVGGEAYLKVVKYWYEDDPGIFPGDQFVINCPYIGGNHPNDVVISKPMFWGDELIGWVQSLTHCVEMGASEAGTMVPNATNIFQLGFRASGLKIVNRGKPDGTVFKTFERAVRDPQLVHLDLNSKIAHNNVVAHLLEEMVKQEGPQFFKMLLRKMIYEGEDKAREKIKKIPDGKWCDVEYMDTDGFVYTPDMRVGLTLEKKEDKLIFDFSGSSPQSPGCANVPLPITIGGVFSIFTSFFLWDIKPWSHGIGAALEVIKPKGTCINPYWPAASIATIGHAPLTATILQTISRLNMCCGLEEDSCGHWMMNLCLFTNFGLNQYGKPSATCILDSALGGTGATRSLDGDDTAAVVLAMGSMGCDVETWESRDPVLFLYRRRRTNSFGHGMKRGGAGGEELYILHNAKSSHRCHFPNFAYCIPSDSGIFGGYPADTVGCEIIKGANITKMSADQYSKVLERGFDPRQLGQVIRGDGDSPWCLADTVENGTLFYMYWQGGGGYGDPLKREPELVRNDLVSGLLSADIARKVYGVIVKPETGELDKEGTNTLRQKIVSERKRSWKERAK